MESEFRYQTGFGNHFCSEALPGALPAGQNTPQKAPYGLYAEQLSGSAFTAPREENKRSWLYRVRPSVIQGAFQSIASGGLNCDSPNDSSLTPNPLRWAPLNLPEKPTDFLSGLYTFAINGSLQSGRGCNVHLYAFNASMKNTFFYNSDGELLFVPEKGALLLLTEFGRMRVSPSEIAVIPRGVKFQVNPAEGSARGYIAENLGRPFRLPDLGPIGANGLANPRDFETPIAAYEDREGDFRLVTKFGGKLFVAPLRHSPFDVVAWHGNYAPYKYNLDLFNTVNSVSFDHLDPSIFTVLTSPTDQKGTANLDFVIFPPRWMVAERTFRPPYYHRNCMSEYMGLIKGVYDAKAEGFLPGGGSLHNMMMAHGPDAATFEQATHSDLKPVYQGNTLAFMFESSLPFRVTDFAFTCPMVQKDYQQCWQGLKKHFDPEKL